MGELMVISDFRLGFPTPPVSISAATKPLPTIEWYLPGEIHARFGTGSAQNRWLEWELPTMFCQKTRCHFASACLQLHSPVDLVKLRRVQVFRTTVHFPPRCLSLGIPGSRNQSLDAGRDRMLHRPPTCRRISLSDVYIPSSCAFLSSVSCALLPAPRHQYQLCLLGGHLPQRSSS